MKLKLGKSDICMNMIAHAPSTINVWTKYGEPSMYGNRETDLITRTLHKFNEVSRP